MPTLNQLRAFVLAQELGSFTAAAERLQMAQPSVSELVRRLEEELGAGLFSRGGRRLVLTDPGRELLPHAEQALAAVEHGSRAVRSLSALGGGTATFGVLRNADYYLLSDLVRRFHARHPAVRVRLVGQNSAETAAAVASGELEAGLVVLPVDDDNLTAIPLLRDEVLFISGDPERAREPVTIGQFAASSLVLYDAHYGWRDPTRRQLADRAQLAGLQLTPLIELEHVESALKLAAHGVGETIAPRAVVESDNFPEGLYGVPFAEPLYDTIALVQRRDRPLTPATREFALLAEEMLSGLDKEGSRADG
ncbi:LysR family transcriptional regulator [Streptomyces sp. ODS28]|uniref:LysR family transcriptional regulator n=1 Tax=Streptomyces sp. ODS28 TaxID=3136688 RepID=UPI0031EC0B47